MAARGRGRPPVSDDERRSKLLRIRLNEAELALIDAAAAPEDTSTWARAELIRSAKVKKPRK